MRNQIDVKVILRPDHDFAILSKQKYKECKCLFEYSKT